MPPAPAAPPQEVERGSCDKQMHGGSQEGEGKTDLPALIGKPRLVPQKVLVSGATILANVHTFLGRFIVYPSKHAHIAHALWVAHAHLMDAWESTPRIAFLSAEPASGKSRALEVTELLVPRPVASVNVTPAYLFRKVGAKEGRPTLLYDEIDTVFGPTAKGNEEIRGLLNAGHRKNAVAGRCVLHGKKVHTEEIPAYCAVALAGLGMLPDTILTRCIIVRMRRRALSEAVEPYRHRDHSAEGQEIAAELAEFAESIKSVVTGARPILPASILDRDADVWEPLIATADAAGGGWPELARAAAVALVAESKRSSASLGIQLLYDLQKIFESSRSLFSEHILKLLHTIPESPWGDLRGKPLDARGLSKMLSPYGVSPTNIRVGDIVSKGYRREDLWDAWERYLVPVTANPLHPLQELRPDEIQPTM